MLMVQFVNLSGVIDQMRCVCHYRSVLKYEKAEAKSVRVSVADPIK